MWEQRLKFQAGNPKEVIQCNGFWIESRVAVETGLFERFWELSDYNKAWIIAVHETKELLERVVEYVNEESE